MGEAEIFFVVVNEHVRISRLYSKGLPNPDFLFANRPKSGGLSRLAKYSEAHLINFNTSQYLLSIPLLSILLGAVSLVLGDNSIYQNHHSTILRSPCTPSYSGLIYIVAFRF